MLLRGLQLVLFSPAAWLAAASQDGGSEATSFVQLSLSAHSASSETHVLPRRAGDEKFPIWVWWDYDLKKHSRLPGLVQAALATWEVHAPASLFEIRKVNRSNLARWLPDLPEEALRLPYPQAYSDLARAGLLATYGGLYMDTDMLLQADLATILESLDNGTADVVTYENAGQSCAHGSFSSNFLAGRKGNELSKAWYASIIGQLKRSCPLEAQEDLDNRQGVCCYTPRGTARTCHIPWGGVGERIGHPTLRSILAKDPSKTTFRGVQCFREVEHEGFAPCGVDCLWEDNSATSEVNMKTRIHRRLWSRPAYHLFATNAEKHPSFQELLDGKWVISELLRVSLGRSVEHPLNATRD